MNHGEGAQVPIVEGRHRQIGAKSLVIHPGSTTHQQLTDDQLRDAGVPPDLVRISVGLEDLDDILWDLDQALAAAAASGEDGVPAPPAVDEALPGALEGVTA